MIARGLWDILYKQTKAKSEPFIELMNKLAIGKVQNLLNMTNTWEQRQGNWAVHSRGDIMNNETREFRLDTTDTRPGTKAIKQETQHKTVTRTCRLDTGIKDRHGDKTQVSDPWSDCGKQRNRKTKYYKTQKKKQNVNGATRDIINMYTRQR